MTEVHLTLPEVEGAPELLSRLHVTLQQNYADPVDPKGSLAEQREEFMGVITAAHERQLGGDADTLVDHYASVVDYLWFSGREDTMPPALGYYFAGYFDREDWGEIGVRDDLLPQEMFDAITRELMPLGLGDLLLKRIAFAEINGPSTEQAFIDLIKSTPAIRWLDSFKVGDPRADMPLSSMHRATREATIRQEAIGRYGTMPGNPYRPSAAASNYIDRHMALLEYETVIRPRPQDNSEAMRRLRSYVSSAVETFVARSGPVGELIYRPDEFELDQYVGGEYVGTYEIYEVASDNADNVLLYPLTCELNEISRSVFLEIFARSNGGERSFDELYEVIMGQVKTYFLDRIQSGFNLVSGGEVAYPLSLLKRVPTGQAFDSELTRYDDIYRFAERITNHSHATEAELKEALKRYVGKVEKYNNPNRVGIRLLQAKSPDITLPDTPEDGLDPDLVLNLTNFTRDPYVPGYKLVAADRLRHRFYFSYTPDDDPYLPDNTQVPDDTRQSLADQYRSIGLKSLARKVARTKDLTISLLAEFTRSSSSYSLRSRGRPDFSSMLNILTGARAFVDKDTLRGTCDTFSQFGKLSVDEFLPEDTTFVTGGLSIVQGEDIITGASHTQLARYNEDQTEIIQIIEWTTSNKVPSMKYSGGSQNARSYLHGRLAPSFSESRNLMPELTTKDIFQNATRQLIMQLGVIFAPGVSEEIPEDYIYGRVRQLGRSHPITVILGALLKASDRLETVDRLDGGHIADLHDARAVIDRLSRRDRQGSASNQLGILNAVLSPVISHLEQLSERAA